MAIRSAVLLSGPVSENILRHAEALSASFFLAPGGIDAADNQARKMSYFPEVKSMPTAASAIIAVANHPNIFR